MRGGNETGETRQTSRKIETGSKRQVQINRQRNGVGGRGGG